MIHFPGVILHHTFFHPLYVMQWGCHQVELWHNDIWWNLAPYLLKFRATVTKTYAPVIISPETLKHTVILSTII